MDFIERWLHIAPDGGNGGSEILIVAGVVLTALLVAVTVLRPYLPRNLTEFLEQLGKWEDSDLHDN